MKLLGLLKHDFLHGLLKRWELFIIAPIVMLSSSIFMHDVTIKNGYLNGMNGPDGTVMDYLMNAFKGMEAYKLDVDSHFTIPIAWFVFYIGLAYIVGYFAEQDLKERGMYTLMAAKSRMGWWLSKCIWCIASVICYFLIAWITVLIYAFLKGETISLDFTLDIGMQLSTGAIMLESDDARIITLLLPMLMAVAVSLLQMFLSIVFGSVETFAGVCMLYILSAYYTSPILIGNYTMWCRNEAVIGASGMDTIIGYFIVAILSVISIMGGCLYIDNYDLLKDELDY